MRKFLMIILLSLCFSGCSFLPKLTFNRTTSTLPMETVKHKSNFTCEGDYKYNPSTGEVSCSKGYRAIEDGFNQKERSFTWKEKIANVIRNLSGWMFILIVALLIFCPGVIGWVFGTLINGSRKALTATVSAIGKFKNNVPTVVIDGKEVPDPVYVKVVDDLLDELENAHSSDPAILTTITHIRLKLKIADND